MVSRANFYGTSPLNGDYPAHHIFGALTHGRFPAFDAMRNTINPSTGRPYFDLANRSDNSINLLRSQGSGIGSVNGTLVHAGPHSAYINLSNTMAQRVQDTFTSLGGG